MNFTLTRRSALQGLILTGTQTVPFFSAVASSKAASLRSRKSIDALSADELENFMHAIKRLKERSETDPSVPNSYAFYYNMHNAGPGLGCEHGSYRFLAWHRAMLFYFEEAMRAIDPPKTKDVTIPYWNWTLPPSGRRYPVAFENDADGLRTKYGRTFPTDLIQTLFDEDRTTDAASALYTWSYINGVARGGDYETFAGHDRGKGGLESPSHDTMHSRYVQGKMSADTTAAEDPIFWSFHTFIDLVWWWRQQKVIEQPSCTDCGLRGMPGTTAGGIPGPTTIAQVIKCEEQLGYSYEFIPAAIVSLSPDAGLRRFSEELPGLAAEALKSPSTTLRFRVSSPRTWSGPQKLALGAVRPPRSFPYLAFVYVHPAGIDFKPGDPEFRDRYLVGHFSEWIVAHEHHEGSATTIAIDPRAYPELSASQTSDLQVTVAVHAATNLPKKLPRPAPRSPADLVAAIRADVIIVGPVKFE